MARPRPDPVYVLVSAFASCANGSNACCWNSELMPMPVSAHVISNMAASSVAESSRHVMARNMQGEQRVARPVVGGYFARGDEMGRSGVFDKHHQ